MRRVCIMTRNPSREYLKQALALAKRDLPGWAFASLQSEARARAGGLGRKRVDEPTQLEKLAIRMLDPNTIKKMDDPGLKEACDRVGKWIKSAKARKIDAGGFDAVSSVIESEMKRRKISPVGKSAMPSTGPVDAPVAFIGASPSQVDAARGCPMVGPAGKMLMDAYLKPLGLTVAEVVKSNIVPVSLVDDEDQRRGPSEDEIAEWSEWITKELDRLNPRVVIALGKTAHKALGSRADFILPHPDAIRRFGNRGEVARKLKRVAKALLTEKPDRIDVTIHKADEEKQIVYGVVLSSYGATGNEPDGHNDWIPPAEIEKSAHDWFRSSGKIGISHPGQKVH